MPFLTVECSPDETEPINSPLDFMPLPNRSVVLDNSI